MTITYTLLYPEGSNFDMKYYIDSHMALVQKLWEPMGLLNWRVSKPHGKDGEGKHLPYDTQCVLHFESKERWDKAVEKHGDEIFADIPKFSEKSPFTFLGDVTGEM